MGRPSLSTRDQGPRRTFLALAGSAARVDLALALVAGVFFWLGLVAPLAPAAFVGAALACFLALDGAAARPLAGFLMEGASATKRVGTERARLETRGSAAIESR